MSLSKMLPLTKEMVHGRNILLIGSAPSASLEQFCKGDITVCINASFAPFPELVPDLLFVNGFTTRNKGSTSEASMRQMHDRRCRHLVCVSNIQTFQEMKDALTASGLLFNTAEELTKRERAAIVSRALGRQTKTEGGNDVASTGVSALLALAEMGAANIKLTGFSLAGGHSYIPGNTQREHVDIDSEILTNHKSFRLGDSDGIRISC